MLCISPQNAWHLEVINVSTGRQMWVRGLGSSKSSSAAADDGAVGRAAAAGDEKGESKQQPAAAARSEAKHAPPLLRSLLAGIPPAFPLPASCCFALSDRVLACCTHERPRHLWLIDFATGQERSILFPQPLLSVSQVCMVCSLAVCVEAARSFRSAVSQRWLPDVFLLLLCFRCSWTARRCC
jgi:hypothetical protein